ncbi:HXXEE domain-containing protein [Francisella adeliensis]|uniref:HXXEE domain-containing protein n=1 Tax=Francisella adeliensis TaxID=2007306 RepID=A0A2Z4XX59_9GAMM|nr:HXXEE domain-containing protein [Francisella adeliensis]AXA33477.1 HXXEE domain-containing protein [Francisella adeliensis]MBK2084828.1 HXXEE domain-containing protein [Francisella adeliensis]MBK2097229.1 HXXEE domain-containing protein [Francisella adeliensis]QIW11707.1 HXXEE domain-containing protein [Francisella adeliensis]QIW13581.1 HXXEE domain-containing protein [Francisella adeliensis]
MINFLAKNQNWAKITPWAGIVFITLLFINFSLADPHFWALLNIPLYLFHQTEEHYIPGGFKDFMNQKVMGLPTGKEKLTDIKIFWINILMVWLAFAIFGALSFINIGFGLLIIIFSIMNCLTHIAEGVKRKSWNPGLVMATLQFLISIYAAYFVTVHGLTSPLLWWVGTIVFSIVAHVILFKAVMTKD